MENPTTFEFLNEKGNLGSSCLDVVSLEDAGSSIVDGTSRKCQVMRDRPSGIAAFELASSRPRTETCLFFILDFAQ